jgi:hypothetical protein
VRYGSFRCGIFPIMMAYKIAVSYGENIQLGRLFRQLRSYVLLAQLHYRIAQLVALCIVIC